MSNQKTHDFDAIVIGSGISGGWAAKELTEKGLKVLVLDRGRPLEHGSGYVGEHAPSWKLPFNGRPNRELNEEQYFIQSQSYAFGEANRQFWNNDRDNPYAYDENDPFIWTRTDVVGGRSLVWGRQSYRFSEQDFKANEQDGHGIPWPVSYDEIAPWYSYVEKFAGINGMKEGLPQLPDGEFQKPMPWFKLETVVKQRLAEGAPDITLTSARTAILTENLPGRAACHYCGPCERGCSTGSYFSSQASTLPAAKATGRMTLRANSLVEKLEYDADTQRVSRVHVIDTESGERISFSGRLVFLCASTIATAQILFSSANRHFPNGLANSSGVLGHYLMDHFSGIGTVAIFPEFQDSYYSGNRPTGLYIPRFRNVGKQDEDADFVRGYGYQTNTSCSNWTSSLISKGFGADYKNRLRKPGGWSWYVGGFGECLPQKRNRLYMHPTKKDRFGLPQMAFDFQWHENERAMVRDIHKQSARIMKAANPAYSFSFGDPDNMPLPGAAIHEMGTARMGDDPRESVLNKYNQSHDIANLFITDGSFMTSSSCVNPSLTYMAFTARACDYAVKQLQAGVI